MAKRIRYVPTPDPDRYMSMQSFNGYRVTLDLASKTYRIWSDDSQPIEGTVKGGPHKLKIAAKKKLEELGISFEEEKRKPKGVQNV